MERIVSKARQVRLDYQARLGRPVTLEEVAEATGITPAALSRLERGQTERIDFGTLLKLCKFYGVQPGDLLRFEAEQPENKYSPALIQPRQLNQEPGSHEDESIIRWTRSLAIMSLILSL